MHHTYDAPKTRSPASQLLCCPVANERRRFFCTPPFLRSAGPSIEVDTLMAEVHGARRAAQTAAAQTVATEPTASKPAECMASAPGARARTASPAPSDTTQ